MIQQFPKQVTIFSDFSRKVDTGCDTFPGPYPVILKTGTIYIANIITNRVVAMTSTSQLL